MENGMHTSTFLLIVYNNFFTNSLQKVIIPSEQAQAHKSSLLSPSPVTRRRMHGRGFFFPKWQSSDLQ